MELARGRSEEAMTDTTPAERKAFEAWYTTHAFDYERNQLGSRECALQWQAWQARAASKPAEREGVPYAVWRQGFDAVAKWKASQPAQEPVAEVMESGVLSPSALVRVLRNHLPVGTKLYAAPLSDKAKQDRIMELLREANLCLKEAKQRWAPSTTNSDADVCMADIDAVLDEGRAGQWAQAT
jgi:hypothetical protein